MRLILTILLIGLMKAEGQIIINASQPYRPMVSANLLLDDYPNAAAAYSLRKLRTAYTGAAIRVRKDTTGQPEQDINFVGNNFDTSALKQFLNARSGFIVTWYDQSGNGKDMSQTTQAQQPRIALNGTIERTNNLPTIRFISSSNTRLSVSRILSNDDFSIFAAIRLENQLANNAIIVQHAGTLDIGRSIFLTTGNLTGGNVNKASLAFNNGTTYQIYTTTNYTTNVLSLWESDSDNNGTSNIYLNGGGTGTQTSQTWTPLNTNTTMGSLGNGTNPLNGIISEMIIYSTKQSSSSGIRTNINNYYGIY